MNTNDVFSKIHDFDLDVPPDLDLNDIGPMLSKLSSTSSSSTSPTSTSTEELNFPWNLAGLSNMGIDNLNALSTGDHFALLHSTATQLYANNAGTLQSLGASIQPHLRGPMTPVLIIAVSIMVSLLVSFVVSIIQMVVLAGVVVYFFPSVVAAVSAGAAGAGAPASGTAAGKPISRTPVAAFAGVLAASYAFSSIATMVVLASSAYAYLNHAAVAAKNNAANNSNGSNGSNNSSNSYLCPDARSSRRDERPQPHSSMFRRISRHRDSF